MMNGGRLASIQDTGGTANSSWQIQGTGDINGDGREDIVWYNRDANTAAAWFLDNSARLTTIQDIGHTPAATQIGGSHFDLV
jgi:hypothetical protein